MKASVSGRVRNTSLPRANALLPVFEAVMNSFQAIEESEQTAGHTITIFAEREGDLEDGKPGAIHSFSVTDSGIGFTDDNFDSFNTVVSPYTARKRFAAGL